MDNHENMVEICEIILADKYAQKHIAILRADVLKELQFFGIHILDKDGTCKVFHSSIQSLWDEKCTTLTSDMITIEHIEMIYEELINDLIEEHDPQNDQTIYDYNEQRFSSDWFRDIAEEIRKQKKELKDWREFKKRHPEYAGKSRSEDKKLMAEMRDEVQKDKSRNEWFKSAPPIARNLFDIE